MQVDCQTITIVVRVRGQPQANGGIVAFIRERNKRKKKCKVKRKQLVRESNQHKAKSYASRNY